METLLELVEPRHPMPHIWKSSSPDLPITSGLPKWLHANTAINYGGQKLQFIVKSIHKPWWYILIPKWHCAVSPVLMQRTLSSLWVSLVGMWEVHPIFFQRVFRRILHWPGHFQLIYKWKKPIHLFSATTYPALRSRSQALGGGVDKSRVHCRANTMWQATTLTLKATTPYAFFHAMNSIFICILFN